MLSFHGSTISPAISTRFFPSSKLLDLLKYFYFKKTGNLAAIEDHPCEVVPMLQTLALVELETKSASNSSSGPAKGVVIGGAVVSDPCLDRAFIALSADGKVRP